MERTKGWYWAKHDGDLIVVEYSDKLKWYMSGLPTDESEFDWIAQNPIPEPKDID